MPVRVASGRVILPLVLLSAAVGLGLVLHRHSARKETLAPRPFIGHASKPPPKASSPLSVPRGAEVKIGIAKQQRRLTVFADGRALKSYPIVLGPDPVTRKLFEGDGCTPEGTYHVRAKYPHRAWQKFIWIDYPSGEDRRRYEAARRKGEVPKEGDGYRGIGGEIGIHGTPDDGLNQRGINWTLGCISLYTQDIEEVYRVVRIGTPVVIRP